MLLALPMLYVLVKLVYCNILVYDAHNFTSACTHYPLEMGGFIYGLFT